jgi:hypothetical protein
VFKKYNFEIEHWKTDEFCGDAVEIHSIHSKLKSLFEQLQLIELLSETNSILERDFMTFSRGSSGS